MEKHFFKYAYGYINIDAENLYMTNSGNFQEARETEEKSSANQAQNNHRVNRMKGFVYGFLAIIAFFIVDAVENKTFAIGGFVAAGLLAYKLFDYFKPEFGSRYRIPLSKIERIERYNKGIKIFFLNANNESDFEIIEKVEDKGFTVLEKLNLLVV